jgi:hypothetical protein
MAQDAQEEAESGSGVQYKGRGRMVSDYSA